MENQGRRSRGWGRRAWIPQILEDHVTLSMGSILCQLLTELLAPPLSPPGFSDLPMALAWIRRNANAWTVFHLDRLEIRNELVFAQYILPA